MLVLNLRKNQLISLTQLIVESNVIENHQRLIVILKLCR